MPDAQDILSAHTAQLEQMSRQLADHEVDLHTILLSIGPSVIRPAAAEWLFWATSVAPDSSKSKRLLLLLLNMVS